MANKSIKTVAKNFDQERVEGYLRMLDRILLYNITVNTMPPEMLQGIIDLWDDIVLKSINIDATMRTHLLEGTKIGRLSKLKEEPDGEEIRMHCINQWKTAKQVVEINLLHPRNSEGEAEDKEDEDKDEGSLFNY
jgi:hypothetical protein